jgi:hypothetical protein
MPDRGQLRSAAASGSVQSPALSERDDSDGATTALILELQLDLALRIAVAFLLGAAAGIERERWSKAARLRTHMLVAREAAIFPVASA